MHNEISDKSGSVVVFRCNLGNGEVAVCSIWSIGRSGYRQGGINAPHTTYHGTCHTIASEGTNRLPVRICNHISNGTISFSFCSVGNGRYVSTYLAMGPEC